MKRSHKLQKATSIGSVLSVLLILAAEEKALPRLLADSASGGRSCKPTSPADEGRKTDDSDESNGPIISALPDLILVRGGDASGAVSTSIDASERPVAVGTAGCPAGSESDAAIDDGFRYAFARACAILMPLPPRPTCCCVARLDDVISRTGPPTV